MKILASRSRIERFEDDTAVMRMADGSFLPVPRAFLPEKAVPGDIIQVQIANTRNPDTEKRQGSFLQDVWNDF